MARVHLEGEQMSQENPEGNPQHVAETPKRRGLESLLWSPQCSPESFAEEPATATVMHILAGGPYILRSFREERREGLLTREPLGP